MKHKLASFALFVVLLALIGIGVRPSSAAPLTDGFNAPEVKGIYVNLTVKDAEVIYAGSLVSVDANGEAVSATDTTNEHCVGRANITVDNTDDGETIRVKRGIFLYNSATNALTIADIGTIVYVVDDNTVGRNPEESATGVEAGRIVNVESNGKIWVDTRSKSKVD